MHGTFLKTLLVSGFFLILSAFTSQAQNLVSNPSFEETANCLSKREVDSVALNIPSLLMAQVTDWTAPSESGTPDMFQACFDSTNGKPELFSGTASKYGTPKNSNGWQMPRSGNNYAGIILLSDIFKDYNYREYLSGKLIAPLKKGKTYTVTFWCSLSDNSELASNSIGVYLSKKEVKYPKDFHGVVEAIPQIANPEDRFLTNKKHWVKVSAEYTATGGEEHLLIGSFHTYDDKHYKQLYKYSPYALSLFASAYYFIDDVCVSETGTDCYTNVADTLDMPEGVELLPYSTSKTQVRGKVFTYKIMEELPVQAEVHFWANGESRGMAKTDENGLFQHQVDTAQSTFAMVYHPNFFPEVAHFPKKSVATVKLPLTPLKKGREARLLHYSVADHGVHHVYYAIEELRMWAVFLKQRPTMKIEIKSYGLPSALKEKDPNLSDEENKKRMDKLALEHSQGLSQEIADKLLALGVNPRQITHKGYGNTGSFPMFKNTIEWVDDLPEETSSSTVWDVNKLKENEQVVLENIYFEPNSDALLSMSIPYLEDLAHFLKLHPQVEIAVHGHTDNGFGKTPATYLQELSENRAKSVKAFLVGKGIAEERIKAIGFGMSQPIADNSTEEGKRKNRRTAFVVLKK